MCRKNVLSPPTHLAQVLCATHSVLSPALDRLRTIPCRSLIAPPSLFYPLLSMSQNRWRSSFTIPTPPLRQPLTTDLVLSCWKHLPSPAHEIECLKAEDSFYIARARNARIIDQRRFWFGLVSALTALSTESIMLGRHVTKRPPPFNFVLARMEKFIMTCRDFSLCNIMYNSNLSLEYTQLSQIYTMSSYTP